MLVLPSVTILPLHREQFGRVLVEAMAAGVPVVGSTSGAIPEVIGDAGLVVPERDAAALAAALDRVLTEHRTPPDAHRRGRQRVASQFAWPVVAEQTLDSVPRGPTAPSTGAARSPGGTRVKVAVVGGAGFIGSNLVDALVANGDDVVVIDDLSTGYRHNLNPQAPLRELDISTDSEQLTSALHGREVVYLTAALARVPRSIEDPVGTHEVNVTGALRVLKAAVDAGVRRVVYSSSSSVYGDQPVLPLTEDMPANPLNPYACQKLMGEIYARNFARIYGLETVCLRYFNVYGPRQVTEGAYRLVIGIFMDQTPAGEPLTIHGDGLQTRDFTWVGDVVRANMLAATTETGGQRRADQRRRGQRGVDQAHRRPDRRARGAPASARLRRALQARRDRACPRPARLGADSPDRGRHRSAHGSAGAGSAAN